jgi:hypothetical protein
MLPFKSKAITAMPCKGPSFKLHKARHFALSLPSQPALVD